MPYRQSWTWVRDVDTGHCYDVPTATLERAGGSLPGVQVLANKPEHVGIYPRRPKHRIGFAPGKPAEPQSPAAPADQDAAPAADEHEE